MKVKVLVILLLFVYIIYLVPEVDFTSTQIKAIENENISSVIDIVTEIPESFVWTTQTITITYSNICIDFEVEQCLYETVGVDVVSITKEYDELKILVKPTINEGFGEIKIKICTTTNIIENVVYLYNTGEKIYFNKISKYQAWYSAMLELYEQNTENNIVISKEEICDIYSSFTTNLIEATSSVKDSNADFTVIEGSVNWETDDYENNGSVLPLRNALIQVGIKSWKGFSEISSGFTDENGKYKIKISSDEWSENEKIYIRVCLKGKTFEVESFWFFPHYYYEYNLLNPISKGSTATYNLRIKCEYSEDIYKATYLHQAMVIAERFAEKMGFFSDNYLRVAFPAESIEIKFNGEYYSLSDIAFCYGDFNNNCISALGINIYNDIDTIVHEYSHYIQCSMGNYGEPLQEIVLEGPMHDRHSNMYEEKNDKSFAMHLTWTESWGYVFAAIAQKYYENEYLPFTMNTTILTKVDKASENSYYGEFQERSIKAFLWSLVDEGLVNSDINYDEFALDYRLPWTPQEWWNMTTVSGTCRLPDFINLIENESYNFNADLDYQSMREYVYDKLTLFNIAPEIVSAIPNLPNASPIISWSPNGSPSKNGKYYANNKFVIRLWDENWNQLYEYEVTMPNVDRFTSCTYQIPSAEWNQIISGKDCLTFFYIGVEGYRVDDVNDIYATSGPYSSKYFVYRLNEGHQKSYTDLLDGTHRYECTTCGIDILFEHQIKYKNDLGNHCEECNLCDYCNVTSSHNYTEYYRDETYHVVKCEDCGYVNDNDHYYNTVCHSVGSTYHTYECTVCGYLKYEKHTSQYTNLNSNPNYHGMICTKCNYSSNLAPHTWGYRIINNQRHEQYCIDCGYSAGSSLHVLKATDDDRYKRCTICGIWVDTGLNDIFPIQGTKPKDPEEETE